LPSISRGLGALFADAGDDRAVVITEVDEKVAEGVGVGDVFDFFDGADADIELVENVDSNERLDRCWHDGIVGQRGGLNLPC
jgi:hypothetical protein